MEDTYSPMLKKYGKGLDRLPVRELLQWPLMESDNNAPTYCSGRSADRMERCRR